MKLPFFRTPYNVDPTSDGEAFGLACKDPSLADQSQAEEADINTLVRRFGLTGQMPVNVRVPVFEDFDEVFDFHTAMLAIKQAESSFAQMPADVRARFDNNPGRFVDFCTAVSPDGKTLANLEEMRKLGLAVEAVKPPAAPAPAPAPGTPS